MGTHDSECAVVDLGGVSEASDTSTCCADGLRGLCRWLRGGPRRLQLAATAPPSSSPTAELQMEDKEAVGDEVVFRFYLVSGCEIMRGSVPAHIKLFSR